MSTELTDAEYIRSIAAKFSGASDTVTKAHFDRLEHIARALADRAAPNVIQVHSVASASLPAAACTTPSLKCPNMKDREGDTSMSYEHYDCKVCGGHIALDYDEMR